MKRVRSSKPTLSYMDVSSTKRLCKKTIPLCLPTSTSPSASISISTRESQDANDDFLDADDMDDIVDTDLLHQDDSEQSQYTKRKLNASENWSNIREQLVSSAARTLISIYMKTTRGH